MIMYQIPTISSTIHDVIGYISVKKTFLPANKYPGIFVCVSRPRFESPFQYLAV